MYNEGLERDLRYYDLVLKKVNNFIEEIKLEDNKSTRAILSIMAKQYVNASLINDLITVNQHQELISKIDNRKL